MPPKHVAPAITLESFSCPHCGALAHQTWFVVSATQIGAGKTPFLMTQQLFAQAKSDPELNQYRDKKEIFENWEQAATGRAFLKTTDGIRTFFELTNLHVSQCYSCKEIAIWRYDTLLYPPCRYEIEPNSDMDSDIRADFEEARTILDLSPRGAAALLRLCIQKLCKQLGKPGKNLNEDIASLVKDGLDAQIQRALDIVRVVGNEAVHPGTMDLKDDRQTAAKLFELVNLIAYDRITRPNTVEALFSGLPSDKIAARKTRRNEDRIVNILWRGRRRRARRCHHTGQGAEASQRPGVAI
jgi:hypothetical protein